MSLVHPFFSVSSSQKPSMDWSTLSKQVQSTKPVVHPFSFAISHVTKEAIEIHTPCEEPDLSEPPTSGPNPWEEGFQAGYEAGLKAQDEQKSAQEAIWRQTSLSLLQQTISNHQAMLDQWTESFIHECYQAITRLFPVLTTWFGQAQWHHWYETEWKLHLPKNHLLEIRIHPSSRAWMSHLQEATWIWIEDSTLGPIDFHITWDGRGCQKRAHILLQQIQDALRPPVLEENETSSFLKLTDSLESA